MTNSVPVTNLLHAAIFGVGSMGTRYLKMLSGDYGFSADNIFLADNQRRLPLGYPLVDGPAHLRERLEGWPLDLAIISTPANTHVELLAEIAALFPSAAVLVEKPLTDGRLDDLSGYLSPTLFTRVIAVGYNWRFHPWVQTLAKKSSDITDLSLYVAEDMQHWPGKIYGMPLYEFSHELDMIRLLLIGPTVTNVTYTDDYYRICGEHAGGKWKVVIRPTNTPKGRWVRVNMDDGWRWAGRWPTGSEVIEKTYRDQLRNIIDVAEMHDGPDGLVCPLWEGVATAKFIDEISASL